MVFDEEEENKIEYQHIFKQFKQMMAELVDKMINELFIDEESFAIVIEKGLKHQKHKEVFEELLTIDNFLVFKKQMIRRNKELELEALKELEKEDRQKNVPRNEQNEANIKMLELEKEKAEIEHAIALSKAVEEERKKLLQEEDQQLEQVLRMSLVEYNTQQKQQQLELQKKQEEIKKLQEQNKQQVQQPLQIQPQVNLNKDETPTPSSSFKSQQKDQPTMSDIYKQVNSESQEQKEQEIKQDQFQKDQFQQQQQQQQQQQSSSSQPQSHLPPPNKLPSLSHKPLPPLVQPQANMIQAESVINFDNEDDQILLKSQNKKLQEQKIEVVEAKNQQESMEERKKRLLAQKERLKQKKAQDNQQKIDEYNKQNNIEPQKDDFIEKEKQKTQDEIQRRKEQLEKKKRELQLKRQQQQEQKEEDIDLM